MLSCEITTTLCISVECGYYLAWIVFWIVFFMCFFLKRDSGPSIKPQGLAPPCGQTRVTAILFSNWFTLAKQQSDTVTAISSLTTRGCCPLQLDGQSSVSLKSWQISGRGVREGWSQRCPALSPFP